MPVAIRSPKALVWSSRAARKSTSRTYRCARLPECDRQSRPPAQYPRVASHPGSGEPRIGVPLEERPQPNLALGARVIRARSVGAADTRLAVGLSFLTAATCGLVHISKGIPTPQQGAEGLRGAGGIIGFLASSPLTSGVGVYAATALLVLGGFFAVLVLTATPVNGGRPMGCRPEDSSFRNVALVACRS